MNGEIIDWEKATVHVMAHALHYGSSVFEGIRAYNTPHKGTCVFRLREHSQRLFDSAKIYRMGIAHSIEDIDEAIKQTIKVNGLKEAYIRPLVFYGKVGMGIAVPFDTETDVIVAAFPWGTYLGEGALENGVDAGVSSWSRLAPNTMPTGAKAGGNYLSSQLISMEARRHGYKEGIALDVNGYVSEGSGENLFIVKGSKVYTPPKTSSILPGITRDTIMTLLKDKSIEVVEENITRESLYLADEVIMCGTAAEITPVRSVDGIKVGSGTRGDLTADLQKQFFGLFSGETEDKYGWLTPIQ